MKGFEPSISRATTWRLNRLATLTAHANSSSQPARRSTFAPYPPLRRKLPHKFPKLPLDISVLFIIIAHMNIKRYTRQATKDGKILVDFLVDNIQGSAPHVTINHKFKSVEWLAKLGGFIPETAVSPSITKTSAPSLPCDKKTDSKPPVTEKQILHFEIARLIKEQTQDGKTAIDFLTRVVAKGERPKSGENFTVAARMRATRELLIRGFGSSDGSARRILSGDTEDLGSDLAKRIRGCSNDGAELVHILVDAMENKNPEAASKGAQNPYPKFERQRKTNPAEGFTASQRVWAACELLRRAYDIRTDHITPADIQAYRNAQTPAANNAAAADSSPGINRTGITPDGIQAEAATLARASKAGANAANRDKSEKRNAAIKEKPDAGNTPSDTTDRAARRRQKRDARKAEKRNAGEQPAAAAENIAVSEKTHDEKRNAADWNIAAAYNTPSTNPGRAARRRQKRAARRAEKRNAANTPIANPIPGIHATDINENTVVFSHEPISPEELARLRQTLAQPDDIPQNARSP